MKKGKTLIKVSALAMMILVMLVAFVGLPTTANGDCEEAWSAQVDLIAGQYLVVGYVKVTYDTDSFEVLYKITEPNWYITETHLAITALDDCEDCPDGIPVTKSGSPKVGNFPFKGEHDYVGEVTYSIAFDDLLIAGDDDDGFEWGECVCIAAHAVVEKKCGDTIVDEQTAWGDGEPFAKSWAMYFCFKPIEKKVPKIPTGDITYWVKHPGTNCYWDVKVTGGTAADDNVPENTRLNGWCADTKHTINGGDHTGTLSLYEGVNHEIVNYILNEVDRTMYNWESIQAALWWFIESKTPALGAYVNGVNLDQDELDDANAIIDDAETHDDYYPVGEHPIFAVWITHKNTYPETGVHQAIIIEIDP